LAGESSADEINLFELIACNLLDIAIATDVRPMLREDAAAPLIDLDLPNDLHTGALKAEVKAADPGEETSDFHYGPLASIIPRSSSS
jgi:hypothetical protein